MSHGDSSDESIESPDASPDIPLCIVCEEAACGVGPFSRYHLCHQHLAVDVADGRELQRDVNEELRPYSEDVSARVAALLEEQQELFRKLSDIEKRFAALLESLNECKVRVVGKLKARQVAVETCRMDLQDLADYDRDVRKAEAEGDMASVCNLAQSMQLSVPDLRVDFEWAARVRAESEAALERSLRGLRKLQETVANWWMDGGADETDVGERSEARCAVKPEGISLSHVINLDSWVDWVSVCSDTSEFRGDRTGRVVPAQSAGADSVALSQPCLVATVHGMDHLTVLSVDGSVRMRCHCSDIDWKDWIAGLHCDRHLVFIAQADAVTVTDLSGRVIRKIRPDTTGFGNFGGITGNAASLFVSGGNEIAVISKATGQLETLITLAQLPHADLDSLGIHDSCLLVADWKHYQVHRVRMDTQQVVVTHPTQRAGPARFDGLAGVAIDSRGRMFVSEFLGQSVRAVAADDELLLWTLGVPGGDDRLDGPMGLAVVTGGPCEQLVVADSCNSRLLVLDLL